MNAKYLLLLVMLSALVFASGIISRDLWTPDEPRIAEVAREIYEGGDWVILHRNGEMYAHKPPMTYWLVALCYQLTGGPSPAAAKIPSAAAATGCVLLTYCLGTSIFGRRAGLLSAVLLATTQLFVHLGGRVSIDTILTFWFLAGFASFWRFVALRGDTGRWFWLALFFVLMGAATLTKGLIGFILPVGVAGGYLLWDWRAFGSRPGPVFLMAVPVLLGGLALTALVIFPWGLAAYNHPEGQAYLYEFIVKHHFERAGNLAFSHYHPYPFFYMYMFPISFFPWIFFLPGSVLFFKRRIIPAGEASIVKYLVTWFAIFFIFFTISKSKRDLYLLPVFPALALMIGAYLEAVLFGVGVSERRRWFSLPIACLGWLTAPILIGLPVLRFIRKKDDRAAFTALVGVFVLLYVIMNTIAFPVIDRTSKSLKPFTEQVMATVPAGESWVLFWTLKDSFIFHTGRVVPKIETGDTDADVLTLLSLLESGEPAYIVTRRKYLKQPNKDGLYRIGELFPNSQLVEIVVEDHSLAELVLIRRFSP